MAKIKLTTKPEYKQGYEAAQANQPRKSPYRPTTAREEIWLEGYNAFQSGGYAPEEPRKRRTKMEMAEAKKNPFVPSDFNTPNKPLPPALRVKSEHTTTYRAPLKPREAGILEKMLNAKTKLKAETDPELRELLYMEFADLEWTVCVLDGPKPSTRWEEYKRENNLRFDRAAA